MPTIEVEDSDVVFVVTGRGARTGGYHVLGPRDLLVMVQMLGAVDQLPAGRVSGDAVVPYTRIFVGGTQVGGLDQFRFEASASTFTPTIEFTFAAGLESLESLVRGLSPFVTVQYTGTRDEPSPIPDADRYIGVRVSRYQREPVI